MSFFISSYDTPNIISPTLFFDSIAQKKEWCLKTISMLDKYFPILDLKYLFFYKNILSNLNNIFYITFYKILINYYYLYNYINLTLFKFNLNMFIFFIDFLKLFKSNLSYLKYHYFKNFFKIPVLKYFNKSISTFNYKTLFEENFKQSLFKKEKKIIIDQKKLSLNLNNILLFDKVFTSNSVSKPKIKIFTNNLSESLVSKQLKKKYKYNIKKLESKIKKKISNLQVYKNNLSEGLRLYSNLSKLIKLNNIGLAIWLIKTVSSVNVNYLEYLNLGRINRMKLAPMHKVYIHGYMYKEIDLKYMHIFRYGYINKGFGDLTTLHKGTEIRRTDLLINIACEYTEMFIPKYKIFFKKLFTIILQCIKLNYSVFFHYKKSFNINYIANIKKILINYLLFLGKYKLNKFISEDLVKEGGIRRNINISNCYLSYNLWNYGNIIYSKLYDRNLIYTKREKI